MGRAIPSLGIILLAAATSAFPRAAAPAHMIAAPTPPMGWNTAIIDYLWFNPKGGTSVQPDSTGPVCSSTQTRGKRNGKGLSQ